MLHPVRRAVNAIAAAAASALLLAACTATASDVATNEPSTESTEPGTEPGASTDAAVQQLLDTAAARHFDERALGSLLAEIRIDGEVAAQVALGEAMSGEPVTIDGRFRNGAVAITYVSTVMMKLAEEGAIDLDEPIATWLPDVPDADRATPRMLANMTAGYPDHVANQAFVDAFVADPFRAWTTDELLEYSFGAPRLFVPGENWDYSHAGYVVLGQVLEAASGQSLEELIDEYILDPLELDATVPDQGPAIPEPAVHAFTLERGVWEDSSYWNPSWTLPAGAVETSSVSDMAASFDAIVGRGELLEESSWAAMFDAELVGFGEPLDGCRSCHTMVDGWSYGLGAVLTGDWVKQTPLFGGYAGSVVTLPAARADDGRAITVAVAVTYTPDSYDDWSASLANYADELALALGGELAPDNPPPTPPKRG
ncbi:serine hydrolase domain-containing protein [Agromyces sp. NPDC049794]|uniref:serine hydrolase domain-containing protein n=1 Tax=unclassified Agromyces TaxID=2639701 RepID=UPI0033E93FA5